MAVKITRKAAAKPGTKATKAPKLRARASAEDGVRVRMYRHGLGDCFLLRFPKDGLPGTFNVLIDCGLIAVAGEPKPIMQRVASDIAKTCDKRLDLVIVTHEHWDHVSGFSTQQAQDVFDRIDIGEVWYAWTEDPDNALGEKLRRERESKLAALERAAVALQASGTPMGLHRADRIASLLGFFGFEGLQGAQPVGLGADGAKVGKTRAAFEYLSQRRGVKTRYCRPGGKPLSLRSVPGVRVYVLGPPEDEGLIKRSAPTKSGKEVYEFAADLAMDRCLAAAFERLGDPQSHTDGRDCPFDVALARHPDGGRSSARLEALMGAAWHHPDEAWRRIEDDWTAAAETLALNLDSHTNNTCLVVAFELAGSGKVLLFAADAQVGNWLSWQEVRWRVKDAEGTREVTGPDLLERTVFYKVGHHGSHNATLRALGLEQMKSDDLIAFLPVSKAQAEKSGWHEMPFGPLVQRLREKTGGRLVLSDDKSEPPTAADLKALSKPARDQFQARLQVADDGLYYEYVFAD